MNNENTSTQPSDYEGAIRNFVADGRISFSVDDLTTPNIEPDTLRKALYRHVKKGSIYPIRKGYYAIITPEYMRKGIVPEYLFIDDLMSFLNRSYYVSLLSAGALHGAGHQQPMSFFVTHDGNPLRNIKTSKHHIVFINRKDWSKDIIRPIKTKSGYLEVSTPEATIFDLIENQRLLGLGRIYEVILELSDNVKYNHLRATSELYPVATRQRAGYILEQLGVDAKAIESSLLKERKHTIYLSLLAEKNGELNKKWQIIVNEKIDTDI